METSIKILNGTRNGKAISITVRVQSSEGCSQWIRKEDGSPLFGTTGYFKDGIVTTYRNKILVENAELVAL